MCAPNVFYTRTSSNLIHTFLRCVPEHVETNGKAVFHLWIERDGYAEVETGTHAEAWSQTHVVRVSCFPHQVLKADSESVCPPTQSQTRGPHARVIYQLVLSNIVKTD